MNTFQDNIKGTVTSVAATFKWELPNLRKDFSSQYWSPMFDCNHNKWQIQLFPRGDREALKDHVAVYLWLRDGDDVDVDATFELSIVDAKNKVKVSHKDRQKFVTKRGHGSSKLIRQDELSGFIVGDTLRILCKINVDETKYVVKRAKKPRLSNQPNFEKFFKSQRFSDVKFVVADGRVIHAHKTILANSSEVFAEMFDPEKTEVDVEHEVIEETFGCEKAEVTVYEDVEYEVLEETLRYIYVGEVRDLTTHAVKLLPVAVKYGIKELKMVCEAKIENGVEGLVAARNYKLKLMVEIFRRTAERNK